jgi:hypothetical protein
MLRGLHFWHADFKKIHIVWMDSKSGSMIFKNIHIAQMDSIFGSLIGFMKKRCETIAILFCQFFRSWPIRSMLGARGASCALLT